jgi:hypothetical protein
MPPGSWLWSPVLVSSLALGTAGAARAQIDYRNLDDDRPVATEDAYPVERYAFELLAAYRFENEADGGQLHAAVPEITYGAARNLQVGLKLPFAGAEAQGSGTTWGLAGLRLFGLYNFNTESPRLPALSLRADAGFPIGGLAGDDTRFAVKAIATRSWGMTRAHLNFSRGFGPERAQAAAEALPRWSASLALDRTLFRSSVLLVGEAAAVGAERHAPTGVNLALGARWQWAPTLVLDLGVTRRLRAGVGPDLALTAGLSYAFAIPGLLPLAHR